jgi:hypothetical protein
MSDDILNIHGWDDCVEFEKLDQAARKQRAIQGDVEFLQNSIQPDPNMINVPQNSEPGKPKPNDDLLSLIDQITG